MAMKGPCEKKSPASTKRTLDGKRWGWGLMHSPPQSCGIMVDHNTGYLRSTKTS
jgi:hypothetical protein